MANEVELHCFEREAPCIYRGECYMARDNGAVLRRLRIGKRHRPLDETWTFGAPSTSDGYMTISAHKVHRIVATAFHGEQPSSSHVVDHIDTNRRNNRPNNLRWVTRLENLLMNPITAKRVEKLYGSIEEFLADPSNPKNGKPSTEFEWMRTVTSAEAEYSRKRMLAWAQSDKQPSGGTLGEWIFGRAAAPVEQPQKEIVLSKTPRAVQRKWRVPAEFPHCPELTNRTPLATYLGRLSEGVTAVISPYGETKVEKSAMLADGTAFFVMGRDDSEQAIKRWSLMQVTFEDGKFVHESLGMFFTSEGAEKEYTLAQGLQWDGGDTFDDYC